MRILRFGIGLICAVTLMAALLPLQSATAQEANACLALAAEAISVATEACAGLESGKACLGYGTVTGVEGLQNPGDRVALEALTSITSAGAAPAEGTWGVVSLNIHTAEGDLTGILFGAANVQSLLRPELLTVQTLPVTPNDILAVLLRTGASTNFPQVIRLNPGQEGAADARNDAGTWVRVRYEEWVGWANADQLTIAGDVQSLPVLSETDITPLYRFPAPMQAFSFATGAEEVCAEAGSGLLLESLAENPVSVLVNGVEIVLNKGITLLRGALKTNLEIHNLSGAVTVKAFGKIQEIAAGEMVRVRLGGADGMTAAAAPRAPELYGFAALQGIPAGLLPEPLSCVVGITAGDARTAAKATPGAARNLFYLQPAAIYPVVGAYTDSSAVKWWKLADASERWVEQAGVRTAGACETVAVVEPSETTPAKASSGGTGGGSSSAGGVPGGGGFAPASRTIWNAEISSDQMSGTCSAALNYCAHLVALSPQGNAVTWKGQELKTYTLARIRENTYSYVGRNGLGDGKIEMLLVFTSPTTFTMTQTVTYDAEPGCQHTHTLAGTIR